MDDNFIIGFIAGSITILIVMFVVVVIAANKMSMVMGVKEKDAK